MHRSLTQTLLARGASYKFPKHLSGSEKLESLLWLRGGAGVVWAAGDTNLVTVVSNNSVGFNGNLVHAVKL